MLEGQQAQGPLTQIAIDTGASTGTLDKVLRRMTKEGSIHTFKQGVTVVYSRWPDDMRCHCRIHWYYSAKCDSECALDRILLAMENYALAPTRDEDWLSLTDICNIARVSRLFAQDVLMRLALYGHTEYIHKREGTYKGAEFRLELRNHGEIPVFSFQRMDEGVQ